MDYYQDSSKINAKVTGLLLNYQSTLAKNGPLYKQILLVSKKAETDCCQSLLIYDIPDVPLAMIYSGILILPVT